MFNTMSRKAGSDMKREDIFRLKGTFDGSTIEKSVSDSDDKFLGYVEGYASTSFPDRENDIINGKALKDAEKDLLKHNKVFFNHQHEGIPVGLVLKSEYHALKEGLFVKVGITDPVIWDAINKGLLDNYSVFGAFGDAEMLDGTSDSKRKKRMIKQVNFYEVSIVGMPANPDAHFTAIIQKYFGNIGETKMPEKDEIKTPDPVPAAPVVPAVTEEMVNKKIGELGEQFTKQMNDLTGVIKAAVTPPVVEKAPEPAPVIKALPITERTTTPNLSPNSPKYTSWRQVEDDQLIAFAKLLERPEELHVDLYGSKKSFIPEGMGLLDRGVSER